MAQAPLFEQVTEPVRKLIASMNYGAVAPQTLNANDLLYQLIVRTDLTIAFDQPASAPAVTIIDPDFPYTAVGPLPVESNVYRQVSKMGGRGAYLLRQQQDRGWEDNATYVGALPPANGGTTAVTTTMDVSVLTLVPITATEADLIGLLDLQADGLAVTVAQDWPSIAQISKSFSLGTNTISGITGVCNITGMMLKSPSVATSNMAEYVAQAHRTSETYIDCGGKASVQYKFLKGPNIRRVGLVMINGSTGFRDVGNALGLTGITLNIGNSDTPINLTPAEWDAANAGPARRYPDPMWRKYWTGAALPAQWSPQGSGIYWYDGTYGLYGRDWIKTGMYTSESVNLTLNFAASLPANTVLNVILDRYTGPRESAT